MKQKKIYLYAPSGSMLDKKEFLRAQKWFAHHDFLVEIDPICTRKYLRFSATDNERLASIHRAARSDANVAMIIRGGYGLTRILDQIDYELVAKAIRGGMKFVGLSDFTALQMAILAQTGMSTWAGPNFCSYFGVGGLLLPDKTGKRLRKMPDEITTECFLEVVENISEGCGWRQSKKWWNPQIQPSYAKQIQITDATFWGGNLTVLTSLLGTPFFPDIKQGILFIEDVGEHPYRIERMLTQLLNAGVLAQQKAIVFGQMTSFQLTAYDAGFSMGEVIKWISSRLNIPVFNNLPFGHVDTIITLPVGKRINLVTDNQDVMLIWGHMH